MVALPGAGYGGYVPLKDILEKGVLRVGKIIFERKENAILANGRTLQGLQVADSYARITGVHYTLWEHATQIRSAKRIEPSLDDPFVYVSEPGKMAGWTEEMIKKELGASAANTEVRLVLVVPVERVWIKTSRDVSHYAVAGIVSKEEIVRLSVQRRRAS